MYTCTHPTVSCYSESRSRRSRWIVITCTSQHSLRNLLDRYNNCVEYVICQVDRNFTIRSLSNWAYIIGSAAAATSTLLIQQAGSKSALPRIMYSTLVLLMCCLAWRVNGGGGEESEKCIFRCIQKYSESPKSILRVPSTIFMFSSKPF